MDENELLEMIGKMVYLKCVVRKSRRAEISFICKVEEIHKDILEDMAYLQTGKQYACNEVLFKSEKLAHKHEITPCRVMSGPYN